MLDHAAMKVAAQTIIVPEDRSYYNEGKVKLAEAYLDLSAQHEALVSAAQEVWRTIGLQETRAYDPLPEQNAATDKLFDLLQGQSVQPSPLEKAAMEWAEAKSAPYTMAWQEHMRVAEAGLLAAVEAAKRCK